MNLTKYNKVASTVGFRGLRATISAVLYITLYSAIMINTPWKLLLTQGTSFLSSWCSDPLVSPSLIRISQFQTRQQFSKCSYFTKSLPQLPQNALHNFTTHCCFSGFFHLDFYQRMRKKCFNTHWYSYLHWLPHFVMKSWFPFEFLHNLNKNI